MTINDGKMISRMIQSMRETGRPTADEGTDDKQVYVWHDVIVIARTVL